MPTDSPLACAGSSTKRALPGPPLRSGVRRGDGRDVKERPTLRRGKTPRGDRRLRPTRNGVASDPSLRRRLTRVLSSRVSGGGVNRRLTALLTNRRRLGKTTAPSWGQ